MRCYLTFSDTPDACFTPSDGYRDLSEVWIADPRDGNAHAALIEALDAFTTQENGQWS